MTDPRDEELIDRYRRGDLDAFEELADRYLDRVVALARRFLKDPHEAMDAGQEVFLAATTALQNWRGDSAFFTWLYRTTYQVCSVRLRKRVATPFARLPDRTARGPAADEARNAEVAAALAEALAALPERRRQVFVLRHEEALPLAEVARRLGISLGAAKSHLHRALADLRDGLRRRGIL